VLCALAAVKGQARWRSDLPPSSAHGIIRHQDRTYPRNLARFAPFFRFSTVLCPEFFEPQSAGCFGVRLLVLPADIDIHQL
jgi:hypothetical protein